MSCLYQRAPLFTYMQIIWNMYELPSVAAARCAVLASIFPGWFRKRGIGGRLSIASSHIWKPCRSPYCPLYATLEGHVVRQIGFPAMQGFDEHAHVGTVPPTFCGFLFVSGSLPVWNSPLFAAPVALKSCSRTSWVAVGRLAKVLVFAENLVS